MSEALRKIIESSPEGTQFTREGLLAAWEKPDDTVSRWVRAGEAREITGRPVSSLRTAAPKWRRMMERSERPPIRVRRVGDSPRSPWLYDEGDCWAYRRHHGGGPRSVPPSSASGPVDERAATVAHWTERVTANL